MSNNETPTGKAGIKTLAIRLEADVHQQLSVIAQLRDSTITDEIRAAIEAHLVAVKAAPELLAKADAVLEDIEREAVSRREAIATLFGDDTSKARPAKRAAKSTDGGDAS